MGGERDPGAMIEGLESNVPRAELPPRHANDDQKRRPEGLRRAWRYGARANHAARVMTVHMAVKAPGVPLWL
jgi:hypothetical protein